MKYMWRVMVKHPKIKDEKIELFGIAANANIAMSKAKKKVKEMLSMKSDGTDLIVTYVEMIHEVEF